MRINQSPGTASAALLAAGLVAGLTTAATAGSLGGPLELQDEGVFYVNAQTTRTACTGSSAARSTSRRAAAPTTKSSFTPCVTAPARFWKAQGNATKAHRAAALAHWLSAPG